jgi:hypothetical protein
MATIEAFNPLSRLVVESSQMFGGIFKMRSNTMILRKLGLVFALVLAGTANACDKEAARKTLAKMTDPQMSKITEEDGWVVVRFGTDYASWTPEQRDVIITTFANIDACISGNARNMEFRSFSGKVIARADRVRGIKVY